MIGPTQKIEYLDGWRGIAIILVLVCHFGPEGFGPIAKLGVTLFFVLSGFFMSKLLFIKKVPLDSFFVRRFTRVIPALWVFIPCMILWARYVQPTPFVPTAAEVAASFTFVRTYFPADLSIWADQWPTSHLWSLNVEEHSYVFLAIVAVVFSRFRSRAGAIAFMAACVVASVAICFYYGKISEPEGASPWFVRTECAALGIVASAFYNTFLHYYANGWVRKLAIPALFAVALSALFFLPVIPTTRAKTFLMVIVAPLFCAFAINHAAAFPTVVKKILSLPILRWFGVYSFSIYLWQHPLHFYALETTASPVACVIVALVLGWLSFRLIENPLRVRLNLRWERHVRRRNSVLAEANQAV